MNVPNTQSTQNLFLRSFWWPWNILFLLAPASGHSHRSTRPPCTAGKAEEAACHNEHQTFTELCNTHPHHSLKHCTRLKPAPLLPLSSFYCHYWQELGSLSLRFKVIAECLISNAVTMTSAYDSNKVRMILNTVVIMQFHWNLYWVHVLTTCETQTN